MTYDIRMPPEAEQVPFGDDDAYNDLENRLVVRPSPRLQAALDHLGDGVTRYYHDPIGTILLWFRDEAARDRFEFGLVEKNDVVVRLTLIVPGLSSLSALSDHLEEETDVRAYRWEEVV